MTKGAAAPFVAAACRLSRPHAQSLGAHRLDGERHVELGRDEKRNCKSVNVCAPNCGTLLDFLKNTSRKCLRKNNQKI